MNREDGGSSATSIPLCDTPGLEEARHHRDTQQKAVLTRITTTIQTKFDLVENMVKHDRKQKRISSNKCYDCRTKNVKRMYVSENNNAHPWGKGRKEQEGLRKI